MSIEVIVVIGLIFLLVGLILLFIVQTDNRARKNFMTVRRIQEEQWQITEQYHQALLEMMQEIGRQQLIQAQQAKRDSKSKTFAYWQ